MVGGTVIGASVLPCVDSGVGVVGADARDFKRDLIEKINH